MDNDVSSFNSVPVAARIITTFLSVVTMLILATFLSEHTSLYSSDSSVINNRSKHAAYKSSNLGGLFQFLLGVRPIGRSTQHLGFMLIAYFSPYRRLYRLFTLYCVDARLVQDLQPRSVSWVL